MTRRDILVDIARRRSLTVRISEEEAEKFRIDWAKAQAQTLAKPKAKPKPAPKPMRPLIPGSWIRWMTAGRAYVGKVLAVLSPGDDGKGAIPADLAGCVDGGSVGLPCAHSTAVIATPSRQRLLGVVRVRPLAAVAPSADMLDESLLVAAGNRLLRPIPPGETVTWVEAGETSTGQVLAFIPAETSLEAVEPRVQLWVHLSAVSRSDRYIVMAGGKLRAPHAHAVEASRVEAAHGTPLPLAVRP